jgi:transcriptional regulator with XRE-family HTH domain
VPTSFGTILRRLRTSRGVSQSALARRLGVCPQYISAVETGEKPFLSADRVSRLADLLELTARERKELMGRRLDGARQLRIGGECTTAQFQFADLVARNAHRISEDQLAILASQVRRLLRP